MKARYANLFWGVILILGGGLFLAQNLGYLEGLTPLVWSGIFGATSLLFLVGYLISGLPIILALFLYTINRDYMANLFENRACGWPLLGIGLALIGIGSAIVQKIVQIDI